MLGTYDVANEAIAEDLGEVLLHDNTKDLDVLEVGRQLVVGHNPALGPEESLHPLLLDLRVLRLR